MELNSKPKAWVGIDPGASGAMCIITGSKVEDVLEFSNAGLHGYREQILKWNQEYDIQTAGLEKVHAMPGQGVSSMFSFGQRYGELIGLAIALQLPITLVTPKEWQSHLKLKQGSKISKAERKKEIASKVALLYPEAYPLITGTRGGIKDGASDAIGIAHFVRGKII